MSTLRALASGGSECPQFTKVIPMDDSLLLHDVPTHTDDPERNVLCPPVMCTLGTRTRPGLAVGVL